MDLQNETNPSEEVSRPNKFKKKNKRNRFLSNAKGFGKRGIYGRGTVISDDQYKYFINILDSMKLGFESQEEKCSMANSVFDQSMGNEVHFASNQIVSKTLESLIGFTSEEHFTKFMQNFSENFRPICSDSFASHVLQKLIEIAFLRAVGYKVSEEQKVEKDLDCKEPESKKTKINDFNDITYNTTTKFTEEHQKECANFVLKIGKFLLNNLEDFIWDIYASHIMRTSILCLSGIHAKKIAFDQNKDLMKNITYYETPSEWAEVAKEFPQRIELWPQFSDLPYEDLTSGFLSAVCLALKRADKNLFKHFGKKILVESFLKMEESDDKDKKIDIKSDSEDEENDNISKDSTKKEENIKLAKVFYSSSAIRLLETLLILAGRKLFTQLYVMLFPGKISLLSLDRSTNFAVQKVIENVKEKIDFESLFDELNDHFEELLKTGLTGVVSALSNTCLRLQTKQGAFVGAIQNALHTIGTKEKTEHIFKCLVKLKPVEIVLEDKTQFVHLHGSIIIQNILKFNKPIFLINSILNSPPVELASVFNTPNGSFIANAYFESKFVGEKSREKLVRHMEGTYVDLAVNSFGSRVIEIFFNHSNEKQRIQIVKQLSEKINQLNGTFFGRIIFKKFRIETYKLSPSEWIASFNRAEKAEKLFKDILK